MDSFDLMFGDHFLVILHSDKEHGLIFNRLDGTVTTINYDDAKELSNLKAMGKVYGIVGRYLEKYLVLIKGRSRIGSLYEPSSKTEHEVYVITQVQVIDISHVSNAPQPTPRTDSVKYVATTSKNNDKVADANYSSTTNERNDNGDFSSLPITISSSGYESRSTNWNPFKLANSLKPMMPTQFLKSIPIDSSASEYNSSSQTNSVQDDSDKRLVEEMVKFFNNTGSFYYSPTLDLTHRFSRKGLFKKSHNEPIWKTADERFFWNKYMLKDLIELGKKNEDANYFISVILQGFIAIEHYSTTSRPFNDLGIENGLPATSINLPKSSTSNDLQRDRDSPNSDKYSYRDSPTKSYQLALVSRRSVFQAGTRYRRRGCDEEGNCANFVETEQIFRYNQHFTSLVILRGSIPLFWFQTGYNYRPPPVLVRSEDENHTAFSKHFKNLIDVYDTEQIISVDCTEQSGREKQLHDAYKRHMSKFNETYPMTKLIEFDFHKHCRGRQCTDAQIEKHLRSCGLTGQLLKDVRYYWNDGDVVWHQTGVIRVNCLDCSDRTNVVQRAIALQILDLQLARLGVIAPDTCPEDNEFRKIMQVLWSTNGNVLSTQYCGTRALFGGDRKVAGYLKDTYSSASRYYISKFRDAYRQAAIDAMLGVENVENNLKSATLKDQYELLNFDPFLAKRSGGALLKDVGNRVSNRLARLKGKFYTRPFQGAGDCQSMRMDTALEVVPQIVETGLIETLGKMNIDWPSSESVENAETQPEVGQDVFAQFSNNEEDNFQDDEFGHLMLSVDLSELQRLKEEEELADLVDICSDKQQQQGRKTSEEIGLTEARAVRAPVGGTTNTNNNNSSNHDQDTTSTTSAQL